MKKKVLFPVLIGVLLLMLSTSCSDGYSLDNFAVTVGTVVRADGGSGYYIDTDSGKKLWVAASMEHYRPGNGQRVFANITLLSDKQGEFDHYVRVNSLSSILTKKTMELTEANKDSIGNDAVFIDDIWFAHGYVNVIFGVNIGGQKYHLINLVENTITPAPNDGKVHLELRHNQNGDPQAIGRTYIVSFDASKYLTQGGKTTFSIKVKTFKEEEKVFEITTGLTDTKVNIQEKEIHPSELGLN